MVYLNSQGSHRPEVYLYNICSVYSRTCFLDFQAGIYFENGSFSSILSPNTGFSFFVSLHKIRRENHRRAVFTQQDTIYSRAHLVLTNLLITSLLLLYFSRSQWFLLFLPPKFLLISCCPIDSYSDICYLGTGELIIFASFLWMIWVDLPFLIYLSVYLSIYLSMFT